MNDLARARRILTALDAIQTNWTLLIEDLAMTDQAHAPCNAIEALNLSLAVIHNWAHKQCRAAEQSESQSGYRCPVCRECFHTDLEAFKRHAAASPRCGALIRAGLDLINRAIEQAAP